MNPTEERLVVMVVIGVKPRAAPGARYILVKIPRDVFVARRANVTKLFYCQWAFYGFAHFVHPYSP